MTPSEEAFIRSLSDSDLEAAVQVAADEQRERAFTTVTPKRWTVGRLRQDLAGLPADMELLVNVTVEMLGEEGKGFIPLVVVDGGHGVDGVDDDGQDTILPMYSIETADPTIGDGRLIWLAGR